MVGEGGPSDAPVSIGYVDNAINSLTSKVKSIENNFVASITTNLENTMRKMFEQFLCKNLDANAPLKEQTMSRMSPRGGVNRQLTLFLFRGLIIAK